MQSDLQAHTFKHQLPEKARIANGMGLNLHSELSSWLEAITYLRNIIAHHSRLWSRSMVKTPLRLNNPSGTWFISAITPVQIKKPFLLISCLVYLCNEVTPGHQIKNKILSLFDDFPTVQVYKLGFVDNWKNTPIWK